MAFLAKPDAESLAQENISLTTRTEEQKKDEVSTPPKVVMPKVGDILGYPDYKAMDVHD
jgi:hypothetical protein